MTGRFCHSETLSRRVDGESLTKINSQLDLDAADSVPIFGGSGLVLA